jgi:tRNA G18 (ribose-2'-O)-methylase SpoU
VLASVARKPVETVVDAGLPAEGVVLVAQGVNDHENLGALYRNAVAFGAAAVVLDERCADPFYRRAVRVSLGHVLAVATLRCAADAAGVRELQGAGASVLALSPSGEIALREVVPAGRDAGPTALVVGAEGPGLTPEALAAADRRVRIEMADGVDSLNVSVAAAVALHHLLAP